ncbi:MAG: hypothetical protein Q7T19_02480 [Caulobacter sp.]|nr:hypothetical protein [Caulobacter sp.]
MITKPDGAAGRLAGLSDVLAQALLDEVEAYKVAPKPNTDIARARRVRELGSIARTAVSIHRLEEREIKSRGAQIQNEADMDDQPDDAETIERKYVELQNGLDRYAGRDEPAGGPGGGAAGGTEYRMGQLAEAGERGPARTEGPVAHLAAARRPGLGEDLGGRRLAG